MSETGKRKKHTLWLDKDILDRLQDICDSTTPKTKPSDVIRLWIAQGLDRFEKTGKFNAKESKANGRGTKRR